MSAFFAETAPSQALKEYPEKSRISKPCTSCWALPYRGQAVQMWTRLVYGPAIGSAPRRRL